MTGVTLTSLTVLIDVRHDDHPVAVTASSAAGIVGLHLAVGLGDDGIFTYIGPELEHQSLVKSAFRAAGIRPSRQCFLPSQPLEVIGRLAADSYNLVYLDVVSATLRTAQEKVWPLLRSGGAFVLTGALLDGIITNSSRIDRGIVATREADGYILQLDDASVMHLPLAADITVLVEKQFSTADRMAGSHKPMRFTNCIYDKNGQKNNLKMS